MTRGTAALLRLVAPSMAPALWMALASVGPLAAQAGRAPTAQDVVRYHALPGSRLEVLTEKTGLLSFFGHDHLIRADEFEGWVDYARANPAQSAVAFTVEATGVRVLTPDDSADLADIQRDMERKVLKPMEFPTIEFRSTSVEGIEGGVRVHGELTLVGVALPVTVDMALEESEAGLAANGEFEAKLRDFGIEPPTAAAGTVKVKNEVLFRLHVVMARSTDASRTAGPDRPTRPL